MEPNPNLRIVEAKEALRALEQANRLFHSVNRMLPADQVLCTIDSEQTVSAAVERMLEHDYSQLPIVTGRKVLGVFSYQALAREVKRSLADLQKEKLSTGEHRVHLFKKQLEFCGVNDGLLEVAEALKRDHAVLVGSKESLIGILTAGDYLEYLHRVTAPFILLSEIELSLRALIRLGLNEEELADVARKSLASAYGGDAERAPTTLEKMTFANYVTIIGYGMCKKTFDRIFGSVFRFCRDLKEVGDLRNEVFHFRREIGPDDLRLLQEMRDFLWDRITALEGEPLQSPADSVSLPDPNEARA